MPAIPLIIAAGAAVTATATTVAATAATVLTTTALTIGGTAITVGHIAAAAAALGVSRKVFESLNESSDYYLSDSARDREEEKLKSTLASEEAALINIRDGESADVVAEINSLLEQINELKGNREYFEAVRVSLNYKLCYAESKEDEVLAKRQEALAKRIMAVREETKALEG